MTTTAEQQTAAPGRDAVDPIPLVLRALKQVGTTHRAVAARLNVSDMSVSRWLSGRCRPEPERLRDLAAEAARALPTPSPAIGRLTADRMTRFMDDDDPDLALRAHLEHLLEGDNPLRKLRVAARVSVTDAAKQLGVTRQYVHELERIADPRDPVLLRHLRKAQRVLRP